MKHLVINLLIPLQNVLAEKYKTSVIEIREELSKWGDILYPCIGRLNIVEILIYIFTIFSIKISASIFFVDI